MPMPRPDEVAKELWRAALPADPRVHTRPMFGQVAAFVNGQMFSGLFGNDLVVRLPEPERATLLRQPGAALFEPMAGRPMREYVLLAATWQEEPERVTPWLERALAYAAALPTKAPKPKQTRAQAK